LWEAATGKPMGEMSHGTTVHALAFRGDGRAAVSGGDDRTARFWDVSTGKPIGPSLPHGRPVLQVKYSPDDQVVATATDKCVVRLWDAAGGQPGGEPVLLGGGEP